MPRINRVRLINYGWRSHRIDDLTLDFHGGLNAEIRLGNGGGKSVLQRLIYQAIFPSQTVSENRVEDYLKDKPAMTVIEWLLDNPGSGSTPVLIVTGALLYKSDTKEDTNSTIHYFTFVSNDLKHLSLDNLPNVNNEAGVIEIESYSISQTKYRNMANNYAEIFYYASENRRSYHQKLDEFGISANNWKEVILEMISSEDPFASFLENSKTTDQLINNYLLPNIEKHLSRNSDNKAAIRSQLSEIIETMSQKREIKNVRDLLAEYIQEYADQSQVLEDVLKEKERFNYSTAKLDGFRNRLSEREKELTVELEDLTEQKNKLDEGLHMIRKEEVSLEYYQAKTILENAKTIHNERAARQSDKEEKINRIEQERTMLYAKDSLDKIRSLNGEIKALELQYEGLDQTEKGVLLARTSATLYTRYDEKRLLLEKNIAEKKENLNACKNRLEELKNSKKDLDRQKYILAGKIGQLEEKKMQAENEESTLMKDLHTEPLRRDFLGHLIIEDINELLAVLNGKIEKIANEVKRLKDLIADKENLNEQLQEKTSELKVETLKTQTDLKEAKACLTEFHVLREALALDMKRYSISESYLYDADILKSEYETRLQKNTHDRDTVSYQIQLKQELLTSAKNGKVYIPNSVTSLLENHKIEYMTGESFLSTCTPDDRSRYLRQNPLLPFSILLDRTNLEKLKNLDLSDELIRQIIPVYIYSELDQEISGKDMYLYKVQEELLDEKKKKDYLDGIEEKIQKDKQKLKRIDEEKENLNNFLNNINAFSYDSAYEAKQNELISSLESKIEKTKIERKKIETTISENKTLISNANKDLRNSILAHTAQDNLMDRFRNHLEVNEPNYQKVLADYSKTNTEKNHIDDRCKKCDSEIEQHNVKLVELNSSIQNVEKQRDDTEIERNKYRPSDSFELRIENTDELKAEFETLSRETSAESQELRAQIIALKEKTAKEHGTFNSYCFSEIELEKVIWSEDEARRLATALEESKKELQIIQQNTAEAWKKVAQSETNYGAAKKMLMSEGLKEPLGQEQILLNFEQRRADNKAKQAVLEREQRDANASLSVVNSVLAKVSAIELKMETETADVKLFEDVNHQYEVLKSEFNDSRDILRDLIKQYLQSYRKRKDHYCTKNTIFKKIYNITPPFEGISDLTYTETLHWQEDWRVKISTLEKTRDMYAAELEHLEKSMRQLINSTENYTKRVVDSLRQISKQSQMRIADKATPVKLLRIELKDESSDSAQFLEKYLQDGIRKLVDLYEAKSSELTKEKEHLVNIRKLINVYLAQEVIPIKVYRFDENSSHSGLVDWDKAAKSNSSGEHSTSCFVIIASMLAFTRGDDTELSNLRMQRYEPIICDNPFAAISSEYLVKPIITIVDHLHLQLIAFTHSTQQSIANSFDVVIQLRNTRLPSNTSRIDVDKERVLEEKMEQASLFSSARQIGLF